MVFKDEAEFTVRAGRGGDGCVSFRKEAFVPKGGPDGGDGGRGGNVIFEARDDVHSLLELTRRRLIKAKAGRPGEGKNCYGKAGEDETISVPAGTLLLDAETDEVIADLRAVGDRTVLAKGGRGGRGNKSFATATHQVPKDWTPGHEGEERRVRAELKLIADVGLVGLPNAGKSTLLSIISRARPKIASYPFTTLEPQLGIVERYYQRVIFADIPGLIEGASVGKGLGHQFLRHIERTRVLLHIVDLSAGEVEEIAENYRVIRTELENFSPTLAAKDEIIAGNKMDIPEAAERLEALSKEIGKPILPLSAATTEGLEDILISVFQVVNERRKAEGAAFIENLHEDTTPSPKDDSRTPTNDQ